MTIEPFTAKRGEILAMGAIVQQYSPSGPVGPGETRLAESLSMPRSVQRKLPGEWQDSFVMHDLRGLDGKRASWWQDNREVYSRMAFCGAF